MAKQVEALLIKGMESCKSIEILLSFTQMKDDKIKDALMAHFHRGLSIENAADISGVTKGNLSRDIKKLNAIAVKCNQYFEANYNKMVKV